ncbi:Fc.00g023330.m01.CDS01 [Cosmosporella sp. VM-42]
MSVISSPLREVNRFLGRRKLANIPKDQQNLLEEEESWAVDLKNQPHGLLHVPGHVLEGVKGAYKARQRTSKEPPARSLNHSPAKSARSERSQNGFIASQIAQSQEEQYHEEQSEEEQQSSPAKPISWPPSPERPEHPQRLVVGSPLVRETPKNAAMAPPPRPVVRSRPAPKFDFASSGAEEELETELPQPQIQRGEPAVNRAASRGSRLSATLESPIRSGRPTDTPPCAAQRAQASQQVIPNTVVQEAPVRESVGPEQRRKRRMKEIHFSDGHTPKRMRSTMNRLPATKTFPEVISSNSTSSSSIIPATMPEPAPSTQLSVMNSVEGSQEDHKAQSQTNHSMAVVPVSSYRQIPATQSYTQTPGAQPYLRATQTPASQAYLRATQINTQPLTQITIDGDVNPFEVFTWQYPAYTETCSGTLWDFIKACVCLDHLRKRRSLRECLYDDFIRAFSDDYQTYVRNAGPGQEALPAVEWYNNLPGRSLFNRMVVTRQNLGYILDFYPKEVIQASRAIHVDTDADEELIFVQPTPAPLGRPKAIEMATSKTPPSWKRDKSTDIILSKTPVQPKPAPEPKVSSEPRPPLTQVPAPPSPKLGSAVPPSTITSTVSRKRAPRPSQYLERLASSSMAPSASRRRSMEERARLREHFMKRKSAGARSVSRIS